MKAGRELDALIAEKIMHWQHGGLNIPRDMPCSYSTNIGAAWEVVDKLRSNRPICHILKISQSPGGNWKVWVYETVFRQPYDEFIEKLIAEIVTDSAPYAICLAALKAIGVRCD